MTQPTHTQAFRITQHQGTLLFICTARTTHLTTQRFTLHLIKWTNKHNDKPSAQFASHNTIFQPQRSLKLDLENLRLFLIPSAVWV